MVTGRNYKFWFCTGSQRWLQSHKLNRRLSQLIVSLLGTGSCQTGPYLIFLGYYVDFMKK